MRRELARVRAALMLAVSTVLLRVGRRLGSLCVGPARMIRISSAAAPAASAKATLAIAELRTRIDRLVVAIPVIVFELRALAPAPVSARVRPVGIFGVWRNARAIPRGAAK